MNNEYSLRQLPCVSVCITTYNQKEYIVPTVMSVLAQAGQGVDFELEVILGDDCSTDGSSEILSELAARYTGILKYHRHSVNLGANENFKYLIRQAMGDFIAHLDGDDYWLPEKLSRQLIRMSENAELAACYANAIVLDPGGQCVGVFTGHQPDIIEFEYLASRGNFLNFSTLLYRASLKEQMLALDTPMIDYEVHLTLARVGPLAFINQPHACYRWMSSTSMLKNQFTAYDQAYLAALTRSLTASPVSVRSQAVAAYVVTTLLSHRHWIGQGEFWQRVKLLKNSISVSNTQLLIPLLSLSLAALKMKMKNLLAGFLMGERPVAARFPRL